MNFLRTMWRWRRSWLLFLVLMIGSGSSAAKGRCPERCQCDFGHELKIVKCVNLGLTVFPENITDIVEYLDLSGNLLTEIPESIVKLDSLQQLDLARNRLRSLPSNLHRLVHLRRLDLGQNEFKDATTDLAGLEHLPRLQILYLTGNSLRTLEGLKSPSLIHLYANHCDIEILHKESLVGLPELLNLNLARNPLIDNIKDPQSPKLTGLDLSRCDLAEFTTEMIQGFPELQVLRLADNPQLYYSTKYQTLRHPKLQKLDVSRCNLDRPGLHGLPSLEYAWLTSNQIKMLPDKIFAKNRELTRLFLNQNQMQSLNKSTFAYLSKLEVLDLSRNFLKSVPSDVFRDNVELHFLNLSHNNFKDFPVLSGTVVSLDVSSNYISRIENDNLNGLPRILHVNVANNYITEVPKKLVSASLRSFILKINKITNLNNVSMKGLPELEKLDLSGNLLMEPIEPEIFFDCPKLRRLHLQSNPWNCDCSKLYNFFVYLTSLETKGEPLICSTPYKVNGYSWGSACGKQWHSSSFQHKMHNRAWGLVLVVILIIIVLSGMIVSIRHSMKLKRQARNHRLEMERAEVRERLRLLQRRSMNLHEDNEHGSEPRIHPLELISPPSYEEAVSMTRLARSLDGLDTVPVETVTRMTASSESLRSKKLRRARRSKNRLRSLSEDNLARRELRREERLRRVRGEPEGGNDQVVIVVEEPEEQKDKENNNDSTARRRSRRLSAKTGTSTDDEDSDIGKQKKSERRVGKTAVRNLGREPRCGYRPSTDGES